MPFSQRILSYPLCQCSWDRAGEESVEKQPALLERARLPKKDLRGGIGPFWPKVGITLAKCWLYSARPASSSSSSSCSSSSSSWPPGKSDLSFPWNRPGSQGLCLHAAGCLQDGQGLQPAPAQGSLSLTLQDPACPKHGLTFQYKPGICGHLPTCS